MDSQLCLKSYQQEIDSHQHSFHQLVLPIKGALNLDIDDHLGKILPGQAAIISAGRQHSFQGIGNNLFIVADIPIYLAPTLESAPLFMPLDDKIRQYIHFILRHLSVAHHTDNPLIERHMLLLLVQLIDEKNTPRPQYDKRVEIARRYIEQHFNEKNVLINAANHAALSPRHLRALFVQYYALPPSQYLLQVRMHIAWKMLKHSQHSIQRIADRCGYTSLSAFSDRFHKHFSLSPMQLRRFGK